MGFIEDNARIKNDFSYHEPDDAKVVTHEHIRQHFMDMAYFLSSELPAGREKALVMTKLEEAMFWSNAAIARVE